MPIIDYSTSAASNLVLGTIPVGPGMEREKVNNAFQQLMADIAAFVSVSGGSSLLTFLQTGVGAGTRDVQSKLKDTLSVEDFYAVGDTDTTAWQKALTALNVRGGGTLIATKASYSLSAELIFNGLNLTGAAVIDARGAVMTSQAGVPGVFAIEGNSNLCGIQVRNMIVDHSANTTALRAFRQQGTARVSWPGCYVRGNSGLPAGYGAWLVKQTNPDIGDTACFWTNFAGAGCRGDFGAIPAGVILEGAANATNFEGFKSSNCTNHIVMRAPTGTTLAAALQPTANCVRVVGAWFEGGTNVVAFNGVAGGYGPFGLLIDSRVESVTNILNMQGATLNYSQGPIVYAQQTLQSVTNLVVNPNNLITTIIDYRNTGGLSTIPTGGGWRFKGYDNTKDVVDIDLANSGHGAKFGLNGLEIGSTRLTNGDTLEVKGANGVGWAYGNVKGLSSNATRARNFNFSAAFAAATSVVVTLPVAEVNANYMVLLENPANGTLWVTGKSTTGFTINSSAALTATVYGIIVRHG